MAARALGRLGRRVPPPPPPADDSLAARAAFFLKAAAAVYLVREHLLEFTVVRAPAAWGALRSTAETLRRRRGAAPTPPLHPFLSPLTPPSLPALRPRSASAPR
jgi:hypothetical protein